MESVTLWDVTGVSPSDVGNVLSFSILPTNGNLLAQQCGAADGTGGGTVSGNSVDVIVSGATGVFSWS